LLKNISLILYSVMMMAFCLGCATAPVQVQTSVAEKPKNMFALTPSDTDMFVEALRDLSNVEAEPNYNAIKVKLENLVQQYPKSKWTPGAQALIRNIDKNVSLQTQLAREKQKNQNDRAKLQKEIDILSEELRLTDEKHKTDTTRLQQENEQLKKDMQLLKQLEVQLERREKMLR
jgi:hypothetical protein